MHFSDTHCHFDFPAFHGDRDALLAQCAQRGVRRILIPGTQPKQWQPLLDLCRQHHELSCGLGMHPCFTPKIEHLEFLASLLNHQQVVALGEIGLHGPAGGLAQQQVLFEAQLRLAQTFALPVILHQVQAHQAMMESLQRVPPQYGGVIHAFSGSLEMAQTYHQRWGLLLGVGGVMTYPRAQKTRRALAQIDDSALVLETDAPDMPLHRFQGMRNSPLQVPNVFRALCRLRGLTSLSSQRRLAAQLEHNADRLWLRSMG